MQIQKPMAVILSAVFALPARADTVSIREIALGTQTGSTVEVRLTGKERPNKLRGRMGLLDNQAFELAVENSGGEPRSILFDQVKSLKVVKSVRNGPLDPGSTPQAAARAIPKGALVEVRFPGQRKPNWLRGRMGQAGGEDFQIQVFRSGAIEAQTLRFADVESIKPVDSLWVESTPAKVHRGIGTGVSIALTAALVLVVVVVIAAATGHLGG